MLVEQMDLDENNIIKKMDLELFTHHLQSLDDPLFGKDQCKETLKTPMNKRYQSVRKIVDEIIPMCKRSTTASWSIHKICWC